MVDKVYEATFKLSKKCECTDVKNSKTIELKIRKRMGHRWITGFKIKIFDPKLDVTQLQAKAENQANMLTSIIIIKSGSHTTSSFSGYHWKNDGHKVGRGLPSRYDIFQNITLDLTDTNLAKIIKDNPAQNQRYHHASLGAIAMEMGLDRIAITEFVQALTDLSSVKMLRDACPYAMH
jgi:hypothetical protein